MAIHSNILAWEIPWTEALGGLQCKGSQESEFTTTTTTSFSYNSWFFPICKHVFTCFYLNPVSEKLWILSSPVVPASCFLSLLSIATMSLIFGSWNFPKWLLLISLFPFSPSSFYTYCYSCALIMNLSPQIHGHFSHVLGLKMMGQKWFFHIIHMGWSNLKIQVCSQRLKCSLLLSLGKTEKLVSYILVYIYISIKVLTLDNIFFSFALSKLRVYV